MGIEYIKNMASDAYYYVTNGVSSYLPPSSNGYKSFVHVPYDDSKFVFDCIKVNNRVTRYVLKVRGPTGVAAMSFADALKIMAVRFKINVLNIVYI